MEIGKTTKLLKATPSGGIFVVHSEQMVQYINQWLVEEGRNNDNITVVSVEQFTHKIDTDRRPITIDHFITEGQCSFISRDDELALAEYCSHRAPFIITTDQDGHIKTRFMQ